MKNALCSGSVALAFLLLPTGYSQVTSAKPGLSPGASDVVRLAQSGTTDEVVLAYVQKLQAPFRLSAEDVNNLRDAGLSSQVIAAMLAHDKSLPAQAASNGNDQRLYQPPATAATAAQPAPGQAPPRAAAPAAKPAAAPSQTSATAAAASVQGQPASKPAPMTLSAAAPAQSAEIERAPAVKPTVQPGDSKKGFTPETSNPHIYYTKSGRQAAEAHALPPMEQLGPGYDNPVIRSPKDPAGRPTSPR